MPLTCQYAGDAPNQYAEQKADHGVQTVGHCVDVLLQYTDENNSALGQHGAYCLHYITSQMMDDFGF